jgi:hypothetical protein
MKTTPADPETQRALWREATELLGGQRPAARILKMGERTMRALCSGERELHDGFLRDMAAALIAHADACRTAERRLSPAFAANLTDAQAARQGKPDARRFGQQPAPDTTASDSPAGSATVKVRDPASICQACGRTAKAGHAPDCANAREPWPTIEAQIVEGDS